MKKVDTCNVRCLRFISEDKCIKARPGDKIILLRGDKVLSGILTDVGTKYIYLRYTPHIHKKRCLQWKSHKISIEFIDRFAVFPSGFQQYGDIYCNGKDKSYGS